MLEMKDIVFGMLGYILIGRESDYNLKYSSEFSSLIKLLKSFIKYTFECRGLTFEALVLHVPVLRDVIKMLFIIVGCQLRYLFFIKSCAKIFF